MTPKVLAVLLSVTAWPGVIGAQDASWDETTKAAQAADFQGRQTEAEKLYLAAVQKAEAFGPTDSRLAMSLENLGMFYCFRDRYTEADSALQRAYQVGQKSEGLEPFLLRRIRSNLAAVLHTEGKDLEAKRLYLDVVANAKKSGKDDLRLADSLEELGRYYVNHYEYDEAETVFKQALAIKRTIFPPDDPNLMEPIGRLTSLYQYAGEPSKAETYILQELAIEEKASGSESAEVAHLLLNLQELYFQEGKYPEVEANLKRLIAIHTKLKGPESPDVAGNIAGLADLAEREMNYAEAEQFYKQALAMMEKAEGPNGSRAVAILESLANLYRLEKDYAQAEAIYARVMDARMKSVPPGSELDSHIVQEMTLLYEEEGKFEEAEALYRKAAETDLAIFPHGHLAIVATSNDLALFLERRDRLAEAETYYKSALSQFDGTESTGADLGDSNLAIIMKNYARLLRKMNRPEEAVPYEKAAKVIDERLTPKPLKK